MSLRISLFNGSSYGRIPRRRITEAMVRACLHEGIVDAEIAVIILDNPEIQELNRQFLQHDYPTDVITFTLEESPLEGEIYIGAEIAAEHAKEYRVTITNELTRLAVHGVLHLAGHDDDTTEKREAMNKLETHYIELLQQS